MVALFKQTSAFSVRAVLGDNQVLRPALLAHPSLPVDDDADGDWSRAMELWGDGSSDSGRDEVRSHCAAG